MSRRRVNLCSSVYCNETGNKADSSGRQAACCSVLTVGFTLVWWAFTAADTTESWADSTAVRSSSVKVRTLQEAVQREAL